MYDKVFFESKFENWTLEDGNAWRFWRASQKNRMNIIYNEIKEWLYSDEKNICEIGCGTGEFTEVYYRKDNMQILGIDISDTAIAICKNKFKNCPNIKFSAVEVLNMPEEEKFDLIICMDILHYYDNQIVERILDKIINLSKNEKKIVLAIPLTDEDNEGNVFLQIVGKKMQIEKIGYIDNHFYTKIIENKLLYLYDVFYVEKYGGKIGEIICKVLRRLLSSKIIFRIFTNMGKKLHKRTNSHIYIIAS